MTLPDRDYTPGVYMMSHKHHIQLLTSIIMVLLGCLCKEASMRSGPVPCLQSPTRGCKDYRLAVQKGMAAAPAAGQRGRGRSKHR